MLVFICQRTCLAHIDVKSMYPISIWGRRGRHIMVFRLQLPMQSVPITTKVVSSNPSHGKVYSIQQFVHDLPEVGSFLRFPPPIKMIATI
jgi:hypothetical protein